MKILLTFLLTLQISIFAQTKGTVVDENNKPISYVNIWVENENIGTTSEENGTFKINITDKNKTLVFSAVGFETKKVSVELSQNVEMIRLVYELNEVVIENPKFDKEIEIGDYQKGKGWHHSGVDPIIIVKFFKFENHFELTPFLKNIKFRTKSEIKNASFNIRFFYVGKNGFPDDDALNENLKIEVKKGKQKVVVDVSKFKLKIPKEGIFIGFEWLIIDLNKLIYKSYTENVKKSDLVTRYEPCPEITTVDKDETFLYDSGKWHRRIRINDPKFELYHNKCIEPAINLILTN